MVSPTSAWRAPLHRLVRNSSRLLYKNGGELPIDFGWCRFGVRDPSPLTTPEGHMALDAEGNVRLFFNARSAPQLSDKGITCVGVATYQKNKREWSVQETPAFSDGPYTAQGSVLQLTRRCYRMYYSRDTAQGFFLATSADGATWERYGEAESPVLQPEAFGVSRMGLPFVRRIKNQWLMFFEGICDGKFHIYLATSLDGLVWQPGNAGRPVYQPDPNAWDCFGQANPSLYVEEDDNGKPAYTILYNGCAQTSAWSIGALSAQNPEGPWTARSEPLLSRDSAPQWKEGRIEGARLLHIPDEDPCVIFFWLPTQDSYFMGKIAFASFSPAETETRLPQSFDAVNAEAERRYNANLSRHYFNIWDNWPIQQFETRMESRLLGKIIYPASRVLVLGCGGGREFPILLTKNCQLTAVDISPDMIAAGKTRYPDAGIDWIEADLHNLPAHLVGFDAAIALGAVFNYLRDPARALKCAHRALKPGGSLFLAVINARHPTETKVRAVSGDGQVRFLYDLASLKKILVATGFKLAASQGIRFFVDLLPKEWNQENAASAEHALLQKFLILEEELMYRLPPDLGKYLLLHAIAASQR